LIRGHDGEEDEEDVLSVDVKRAKPMDLYMNEREGKPNADCPKPEPTARYQCPTLLLALGARESGGGRRGWWGQARLVGAGEANGGRKLPGQTPSQYHMFPTHFLLTKQLST